MKRQNNKITMFHYQKLYILFKISNNTMKIKYIPYAVYTDSIFPVVFLFSYTVFSKNAIKGKNDIFSFGHHLVHPTYKIQGIHEN